MAPTVSPGFVAPVRARDSETDLALRLALDHEGHWLSAWTIRDAGRMLALAGDAEVDEGMIHEAASRGVAEAAALEATAAESPAWR